VRGGEFDILVIVGVEESVTNWLLWAWRRVCQTCYCERGGEFDKLVIVGVGESLINCLLWAWGRV
jgi:Flp pilus assembly pilin Flp